jgi:hypothetical protein
VIVAIVIVLKLLGRITQTSFPLHRNAMAFMVVPWLMSGGLGSPAALPWGDPELKVTWLAYSDCEGVALVMRE